jgi:hypothetical protein
VTPRPSPRELQATLALFNQAFFGGVLRPAVHWRRMRDHGSCYEPSGKYPYGLIVLSTILPDDTHWEEILLHELIHNYLDLLYPGTDEYADGAVAYHGPVFTAEANRIGRWLGVPEVDEEHAWAWPHCVKWSYNPEPASY